jgi:hypothetical protein
MGFVYCPSITPPTSPVVLACFTRRAFQSLPDCQTRARELCGDLPTLFHICSRLVVIIRLHVQPLHLCSTSEIPHMHSRHRLGKSGHSPTPNTSSRVWPINIDDGPLLVAVISQDAWLSPGSHRCGCMGEHSQCRHSKCSQCPLSSRYGSTPRSGNMLMLTLVTTRVYNHSVQPLDSSCAHIVGSNLALSDTSFRSFTLQP